VELVQPARRAHRRAVVAEVPLDLTLHRRSCIRREIDAALRVEPVDGLDQPDRPDLLEIVDVDALAGVLAGDGADEREVLLDQALPRSVGGCSGVNRALLLPVIVVDVNDDRCSTVTSNEKKCNRIAKDVGSQRSRKGIYRSNSAYVAIHCSCDRALFRISRSGGCGRAATRPDPCRRCGGRRDDHR
jgi:hypothetical protein